MNDSITKAIQAEVNPEAPVIVTEVYRSLGKNDPYGGGYVESYGFHLILPDTTGNWNIQPFVSYDDSIEARFESDGRVPGSPTYMEAGNDLYSPNDAHARRIELAGKGFTPYRLNQLPEAFREYVIGSQCPLEWQGPLNRNDPAIYDRVRVWAKGDFPS